MHQVHQKARAGPKSQNESAETTFYQSLKNVKLGKLSLGLKKAVLSTSALSFFVFSSLLSALGPIPQKPSPRLNRLFYDKIWLVQFKQLWFGIDESSFKYVFKVRFS